VLTILKRGSGDEHEAAPRGQVNDSPN
jgi:hypothetical protein